MAATGTITISGSVTTLPGGSKTLGPLTISAAAAVSVETQVVLASGANTITVPTTATAAIIVFDSTSTVTKTLKGVTGDTGIAVTKVGVVVLQFHTTPPADFCITAGGADTAKTTTIIFV